MFYKPKKTYNLFNPSGNTPFRISRSKIELFVGCPYCFYLECRHGMMRPPGFPFNLNSAVDLLLKKEFDHYRKQKQRHPIMERYKIDALPFDHPSMDTWRENFKGVQYLHPSTNLLITGAVDDVWVRKNDQLIVVDYKATSKDTKASLDAPWQDGYKRQVEIYQWLLRQNGFDVHPKAIFVYCNGKRDEGAFNQRLLFDMDLLPYEGDDSWIEGKLQEIKTCLTGDSLPSSSPTCEFCTYRRVMEETLKSL